MKHYKIYSVFIFLLIVAIVFVFLENNSDSYEDKNREKNIVKESIYKDKERAKNINEENATTEAISRDSQETTDSEVMTVFRKYIGTRAYATKNKYIVFRNDDVGAFWSDNTAINVTETFRIKKVPLVLGIISLNRHNQKLTEDNTMMAYLTKIKSDPLVEFAIHGYDHEIDEFKDVSYEDAVSRISSSSRTLNDAFGVTPTTLVPPYNSYNNNTIQALKNEFGKNSVISSGYYDILDGIAFTRFEGVMYIPQTTDIYDYDKDRLHPVEIIVNSCEYAISRYGICVITLHHTRFAGSGTEIDAKKLDLLYDIIDWAKKKEEQGTIKIASFKDIDPSDLK